MTSGDIPESFDDIPGTIKHDLQSVFTCTFLLEFIYHLKAHSNLQIYFCYFFTGSLFVCSTLFEG